MYTCPVTYDKFKVFVDVLNRLGSGKKIKDFQRDNKSLSGYVFERIIKIVNTLALCTEEEIIFVRESRIFLKDGYVINMRGEKLEIVKRN